MKAKINDLIQTLINITADFSDLIIPKGTLGAIVECYPNPEAYAIDLMISNPKVIGGFTYENVILSPEQFIVISSQSISVRSPDLVDWVMGTQPNIIPMML
ncbi:hypothetical protein IQ232_02065 [Microcystis aeruginosa LEGE 11464]|jgi:hypothetical protein|uniref:hypothetical protein n=1 Tax=Microcystis TaxID=1125 RepID=UPI001880AB17|nr:MULTISPECIES: hypothetical protein [Microcystis]MBE9088607.1 hypothetical protein [Microcystis aeruginosa LEGE 11464]MCA2659523.1 hypothetical protein [Microcystis sp. M049S2]MCZ8128107.1 hypothetical protein [Microcystis sp. LE19-114.1B]